MGLYHKIARMRSGFRPGDIWTGPAAICDDASVDHRHGLYALTEDGRAFLRPLLRLTVVDLAPGNPEDGACQVVVSGRGDPPQRPAENVVTFVPDQIIEDDSVGT